jgi:hypothetical protein
MVVRSTGDPRQCIMNLPGIIFWCGINPQAVGGGQGPVLGYAVDLNCECASVQCIDDGTLSRPAVLLQEPVPTDADHAHRRGARSAELPHAGGAQDHLLPAVHGRHWDGHSRWGAGWNVSRVFRWVLLHRKGLPFIRFNPTTSVEWTSVLPLLRVNFCRPVTAPGCCAWPN